MTDEQDRPEPAPLSPEWQARADRIRVAADAISRYDWDNGVSANGRVSRHQRGEALAVLNALDEHFGTPAAIEARVRAEVAEEIAVKIERSAKDQMAEPVTEEDPNIALGLRFASKIARLAAGSSRDTTPEPRDG